MLLPWQAPEKQLSLQLLQTTETAVNLYLQPIKTYAFCPSCGTHSRQLHSYYYRKLQDLSFGIKHVIIHLKSRKWFCRETWCRQHIFTERFTWLQAYARRTERLQEVLRKLAFSMSCRQAERVAQSFLPRISHDTLLRLIRTAAIELAPTTAIGLDDFAFRKGYDYGTLICNLETHQPLAILPGRTSEVVEAWLQRHPHIQTISRDGSKTYREAITNANPQITQVSDRWHLIKNAKEALVKWLEQKLPAQIEWSAEEMKEGMEFPAQPIDEQRWQLIRQIQQAYQEGLRVTHIAEKYEVSRGAVYNYLKQTAPPQKTRKKTRPAQLKLQPYHEAIIVYDAKRYTLAQILKKIRQAGYDGSPSALRRFLEPYRAAKKKHHAQTLTYRVSRTQMIKWIWSGFNQREEEHKQIIRRCQGLYPFIESVEKVTQEYRILFENRNVKDLIAWINTQLANRNSPFYSYSTGLRLDIAAVKNAFLSPYSNGLLEGQINRLKWVKRMMYGRAKPDLLEKRLQYQF